MDEPAPDCAKCARLLAMRWENISQFPDWHNGPVPSFGDKGAGLLIVGLAPGLKGANRTGRPFTGDYAGDLLYPTLLKFGHAQGAYGASATDGLGLVNCRITNAVRCVPPQNKVTGAERKNCQAFLSSEIQAMERLRVILALGTVAHAAVLAALGEKISAYKFSHGALHPLPGGPVLADSYHCSRYNTNTGRLSTAMFEDVFAKIGDLK